MSGSADGPGWALADVSAIPGLWNVGGDGVAIDEDEAFELIAERDPGIIERWEEIERRHPGYDDEVEYHSVRQHFGIRAFGAAAWSAPAGQCLIPPHSETEADYHQEELYILMAGYCANRLRRRRDHHDSRAAPLRRASGLP